MKVFFIFDPFLGDWRLEDLRDSQIADSQDSQFEADVFAIIRQFSPSL
jgi:hypothetical protein